MNKKLNLNLALSDGKNLSLTISDIKEISASEASTFLKDFKYNEVFEKDGIKVQGLKSAKIVSTEYEEITLA